MMRKSIAVLLFLVSALPLIASPYAYISGSAGAAFETNAFSSPLPDWDPEDMNFSYKQKTAGTVSISADIFFKEGPAGLSAAVSTSFPFISKVYDSTSGRWEDNGSHLPSLSFSAGPVFRYGIGSSDLFLSIRGGVGTDDLFSSGLTFDVIIDGGVRFFLSERMMISIGAVYDARLMKFYLDDLNRVYEPGYIMLSIGGYVGVGIRVGER